jgi:hypothetical protein
MAAEKTFVMRAEGVNFAATMDDTHDLSTVRGAGLALLEIGGVLERGLDAAGIHNGRQILSGASQAAIEFQADEDTARAALASVRAALGKDGPQGEPFPHLSFVVDLAEGQGEAALDYAEARNHARQLRQWTMPLPPRASFETGFDPFDRARPATVKVRLPRGKVGEGTEGSVSPSVASRREYGRKMRQAFYGKEAKQVAKDLAFVDSFGDLVEDPPARMPLSLRSRMAVFYADGNAFGKIREVLGSETFGPKLSLLRRALLATILDWFRAGLESRQHEAFARDGDLRIETLLWGGDEMIFVVPSWLAFALVEGFFASTRAWSIDAQQLTHSVGVVVCDLKTPIRQARQLAKEVAETVKQALGTRRENAVGIEIFESIAPPDRELSAHRARSYALDPSDEVALAGLARALAFPGDDFAKLRVRMREVSGGKETNDVGLPRSQLYRAIKAVRAVPEGLASRKANDKAREVLADYEKRVRKREDFAAQGFRLPRLGTASARSLALELALIAAFQDYFDPFADAPLPPFSIADARS